MESDPNAEVEEDFDWWSSSLPILPSQPMYHLESAPPFPLPTTYSDSSSRSIRVPLSYHASPNMSSGAQSPASFYDNPRRTISAPQATSLRKIRFVPNDGQPHSKRRRIIAACLTCRKRKVRCSGERPECNTCTENGQSCKGYASEASGKTVAAANADSFMDEDDRPYSKGSRRDSNADVKARPSPRPSPRPSGRVSDPLLGHVEAPFGSASLERNHTQGSVNLNRHRAIPYFRYFGPLQQMSWHSKNPLRNIDPTLEESLGSAIIKTTLSSGKQQAPQIEIPSYDTADTDANAPLIVHLCETFFSNVGCNFPFLQREKFIQDLEEKQIDAILVNAVCGLAARFSSDPLLVTPSNDSVPVDDDGKVKKQFTGHVFAQRAISSISGAFQRPTIARAQACLLLAYIEFGSDQESGLWMYLGTSIRMAQELGIYKLEGLQLEGRIGSTPKTSKSGVSGMEDEARREAEQRQILKECLLIDSQIEDQRARERERIDTFFAIFFLDRAVSAGIGRPFTLRDKDIEISFPHRGEEEMLDERPHPFPPMIQTVHIYGRIVDILSSFKKVDQITPDIRNRLQEIEKDLIGMHERLSPKLHFNAVNFQQYVIAQQGTNFILLHFWFHALIILLHQPALLHSNEAKMHQLFPNSRELSMSSAKTIVDIIAFAELIDIQSIVGNPFASQPVFIAARAFLAEVVANSALSSNQRTGSHSKSKLEKFQKANERQPIPSKAGASPMQISVAKTNYQRCYTALKTLESYWAGCEHLLITLDEMSKDLIAPEPYVSEATDDLPSAAPSVTTSGTRQGKSRQPSLRTSQESPKSNRWQRGQSPIDQRIWSPGIDPSQAIGLSMAGTGNSTAPNMSFLYQNRGNDHNLKSASAAARAAQAEKQFEYLPNRWTVERAGHKLRQQSQSTTWVPPSMTPSDSVSATDPDLLLNMHSPLQQSCTLADTQPDYTDRISGLSFTDTPLISQDVDISNTFTFPGVGDMTPLFEYLPQDILSYFGEPKDEGDE